MSGAIIALVVPAPLVPLVAFASHFVGDLLPHSYGEEPPYSRFLKIQMGIDAILSIAAIILLVVLFPSRLIIVAIGAFFAFLPDAFWIFWRKGPKWLDKILDFAHWIQWGERPYGFIFDLFYGFLFGFTLFALAGKV